MSRHGSVTTGDSLLFSSLSHPDHTRASTYSHVSVYSRDSWCSNFSNADSDISIATTRLGHVSHDRDGFSSIMSSNITPSNAIFGSTSPRKNRNARSRTSLESTGSSSSASVRSPQTPVDAALLRTPRRPQLSRLVSDDVYYIGRSRDVPISEEGLMESKRESIRSNTSTSSKPIDILNWSSKDGLMIAMAELEHELERTMVALNSPSASPQSSLSKASTRRKSRRPHTADAAVENRNAPRTRAFQPVPSSLSAHDSYESEIQQEAIAETPSSIRFSLSDLDAVWTSRPVSTVSDASSAAISAGSLVFDGRLSATSSATSSSTQSQPLRKKSLSSKSVKPASSTSMPMMAPPRKSTDVLRSPTSQFYANANGARSVPSLSAAPPREPLPPLPPVPSLPATVGRSSTSAGRLIPQRTASFQRQRPQTAPLANSQDQATHSPAIPLASPRLSSSTSTRSPQNPSIAAILAESSPAPAAAAGTPVRPGKSLSRLLASKFSLPKRGNW
ncbi:hypothetical protein BCV70DRAFT_197182 [Testicularia cyperi]|uniref:Uncharacterized protein n=1 Tax=Testicularia cyperi TaxID=1882483 RepID=A0A317XYS7_9BASI|nr:hypothetical protein BCV70DRAFT_197182 [Testicularia cyperi]